jgi:hypothetical protein
MKETLTTSQVAHALLDDDNAGWTYEGAYALAEYLEQLEEDCGIEIEFDRVAIRCDFSEYESAREVAKEYSCDLSEVDTEDLDESEIAEAQEEYCLEWLRDRTEVIEFSGGVIIQDF